MIVRMRHLTLLCLESEKKLALAKLAELGVMHVVTSVADTESILSAKAGIEEVQRAITVVHVAASNPWTHLSLKASASTRHGEDPVVREINRLADHYLVTKDELRDLTQEITRYEPWGDFDPIDAAKLASSGVPVTLFKAQLSSEVPVVENGFLDVLGSDKNGVYGVVIGVPLPEGGGLAAFPMPKTQLSVLVGKRNSLLEKQKSIATKLAAYEKDLAGMKAEMERRSEVGEYVTVFENMPTSGVVSHIEGFIDARRGDDVMAAAKSSGWGVALREPSADEHVPTLLEPPRLFRPVIALFSALGITPGYRETDVSVPFFIFFSIFFAMLVGDAGYGALILLFTAIGRAKAKKRAGGVLSVPARSTVALFTVFGLSTIAYGVLSGTYFGIQKTLLPSFLQFKSIAFLDDQDTIMQLCFTLGALHLSLARLWNAAVLFPAKKFLAEIGWLGVVWSMYLVICGIVISGFNYPSWGMPVMIASILLIVLFMIDFSKFKEQGVDLGMLPLSIINNMGDIISYVRLFAVGLASVKIAENFNMMALDLDLPMLFKVPAMALILVLGHGLNLAMGALSIIVHAVRLNTLEFSGAKGVTWSGRPFKAFKATVRDPLSAVDSNS